jgi:hypothetical protein
MSLDADIHEAMRILAAMRGRAARIDRLAVADHARVDAWRDAELGDLPGRIALAEQAIEQMAVEYTAERKAKTVSTPWGRVAARTTTKWEWDDDVVLAWAQENAPDFLVQLPPPAPRLDKTAFKQAVPVADGVAYRFGEAVPGVTVQTVTTATITTDPAEDADDTETEAA